MSQSVRNKGLIAPLRRAGVVPVLTIDDVSDAIPLAEALVSGGLTMLEITLRTETAFSAISQISQAVPDALVGAGTVLSPEDGEAALKAGARFLVSPGISPRLAAAAETWPVPFLPGVATVSEVMALRDMGYRCLKFFPAEASGGARALAGIQAPIRDMSFCPTGGVTPANAADYLSLKCVEAVGGSWMAPANAIQSRDFESITDQARRARALVDTLGGG